LVVEARDSLLEYGKYLAIKFQVMVHTIEGRKQETRNFMKETERTTDKVANTPPGGRRDTWIGKNRTMENSKYSKSIDRRGRFIM
jgi:hypothetical protein